MSFWSMWPVGLAVFLSALICYHLPSYFGWFGIILALPVGFVLGYIGAKISIYLENRRVP